jgi:hypothetical protein
LTFQNLATQNGAVLIQSNLSDYQTMAHISSQLAAADTSNTSDIYQINISFPISKRIEGTYTFTFLTLALAFKTMSGSISIHLQFIKY